MAQGWERLAHATLGSAGTSLSSGTFTPKTFLHIIVKLNGSAGDDNTKLRVGNGTVDTGSNYTIRRQFHGGTIATNDAQDHIRVIDDGAYTAGADESRYSQIDIINVASDEKQFIIHTTVNRNGAQYIPKRYEAYAKWANTSAQINIAEVFAGQSMDAGAEITVYGYDDASTTAKDKSTITNVPAGTRYEETDTRKIFRRKDDGFTAGIGSDADWTTITSLGTNSTVTSPTGLGANSWTFDGNSTLLKMDTSGRSSLFPVASDFSITMWTRHSSNDNTTSQNQPYFFPTDGSGVRWEQAYSGSGVSGGAGGRVVMDLQDGSNSSNTDANGKVAISLTANTWYLWVYTFDASDGTGTLRRGKYGTDSQIQSYTSSGTTSCTGAPDDAMYLLGTISSESFGNPGTGRMNDVAIWNKVLTTSEQNDLFNSGGGSAGGTAKKAIDVDKTALRAYWDCQTATAPVKNLATKSDWVEKGTA